MNALTIMLDVAVMLAATVLAMLLIGVLSRRILGVRVGIVRILVAGAVGLGAQVGFESQFVWRNNQYTPALIPVQLGIIMLVAITVLVLGELIVPQGSVPRPDQWLSMVRRSAARTRRYLGLTRIATSRGLVPFRLNGEPTSAGHADRVRQAIALKSALEDAGGAFVKLGQILSTRSDVLPAEFTEQLGALQQQVPAEPWERMRAVLETSLGRALDSVFTHIDERPLAAASIGQVHRATLVGGEAVAVKIQRPGIVPLIERDVDIATRLARRLTQSTDWGRQFGLAELADSLTGSLRDELDYRIEASHLRAMDAAQQRHAPQDRLRIPRLHAELSSRDVLVMEFVDGRTLSDPAATAQLDAAARASLATRLFRSTLVSIMDDGVFHSDLHPGNVIITDTGEAALLDFGSAGRLDSEVRGQITDVLLAFSGGDARAFADALIAFVALPDDVDEGALRRQIGDFMARHLGPGAALDVTAFARIVAILADNGLAVPAELATAFRAIATVEGTLRVLSAEFDLIAEASAFADERIAAATAPAAAARALFDEVQHALPALRRLPHRIDRLTTDLAQGRLNVNVRLLADRRDRSLLREFINLAALTFLAGVFGIMAAMLLTSAGGPSITPTLSLFQLFGYLLVVMSGVLTLRVLFDTLRRR